MSTPPPYPQQQYPHYPQYPVGPPPKRRTALPWLIGGAVVVVAALVVTLVLVLSGDSDEGDGGGTAGGTSYDLSSPEKAAESVVAAAKAGNTAAFLTLTCVGTPQCIKEYGEDASQQDIADFRDKIEDNLDMFADQMADVEFGEARETSDPGVWEVPYETPNAVQGEEHGLTFVEVNGDWLWLGGSFGGSGTGGGAGSGGGGQDATPPPEEAPTTFTCPPTPPPPPPGAPSNPFPTPSIEGC